MNINTKCTGPPAVHNTKAICKGKDQRHSYRTVPDYTQHVSSRPNEATAYYLPSIPLKHPREPPTHWQGLFLLWNKICLCQNTTVTKGRFTLPLSPEIRVLLLHHFPHPYCKSKQHLAVFHRARLTTGGPPPPPPPVWFAFLDWLLSLSDSRPTQLWASAVLLSC